MLNDKKIRELALQSEMIKPFSEQVNRVGEKKVVSWGLTSYGYDVRLGNHFKIFTNVNNSIVDPKDFDENSFVDKYVEDHDYIIVPPNSFALAETKERFKIPRSVLSVCVGKSTYARCGIIVNVTPIEPEWDGVVTIEISNTTPLPAKVYAGEGIAQFIFLEGTDCEKSYNDKNGKYQHSDGLTLPKLL